jgi:hypothetical protein
VSQIYKSTHSKIKLKPITTFEIGKIIKSLKSKDSHSYGKISTNLLKRSSPLISSPLNYICNKVLIKGIFHDRLKFSVVKPSYKIGNDISNYRPMFLLSSFPKIFEKLMQTRLL